MLTYADVCYTGVDAGCRRDRARAWERDGDYDAHALLQDAHCFVDCTGTICAQFTCVPSTTVMTRMPFYKTRVASWIVQVLSLLALLVQKVSVHLLY